MRAAPLPNKQCYPYAFEQGRKAGVADRETQCNPFVKGKERDAWMDGWRQGQLERQGKGR